MTLEQITTFLFSDIEHSTQLAQQLREEYPRLLDRHRSTIREALARYEGKEIDTAGDGFFMTFQDPENAVLAAAEIQREFQTQEWATAVGLKVRMGIHTGIALATKTGYTGVEVHCASRICDAAYGGQVLISQATQKLLRRDFVNNLSLSGLGEYIFKDFEYPVELFQLVITGLETRFPKPRINPEHKRIAVLPFADPDNNSDHEYIGDGIAEELIVALGKVAGLKVVSRSSSFAIRDTDRDARHVGRQLDVQSVLDGRLRFRNDHLWISVELIDTDTGFNLWSASYDSSNKALVRIQDEIVHHVADALECLHGNGSPDSIQHRQTHNAEAYDYYLRGRRFYLQFSRQGMELALQMFQKAIKADSTYALAFAGLADCYSFQYLHKKRTQEIISEADSASRKAVELAPDMAEVYVSRGIVLSLRRRFEEAEKLFQYAVDRDPNLFLGWFHFARNCFAIGKLDKAARLFEQANQIEPEDFQSLLLAAQSYDDVGCKDLGRSLRQRGVAIAEKLLELNPGDTRALYLAANALAVLNEPKRSLTLLKRALSLEPDDSMVLYNAGCIYALLGMKQEALSCLERSYQAGLTMYGWFANDSNLDSLRDSPRFVDLMSKIQFESS